jgi:hypothetical protein
MKIGVVTTGNSLDHTEMDDKLMLENGKSLDSLIIYIYIYRTHLLYIGLTIYIYIHIYVYIHIYIYILTLSTLPFLTFTPLTKVSQ